MAKTLTEQPRLWGQSSLDPVQFGDGAPVHSAILYDLVRMANNMQTYCSPHMGFASDICPGIGHGTTNNLARCMIARTASNGSAAGTGLLLQVPILVPVDAVRLNWSLGIYRHNAAETAYAVNVGDITMYLAAGPCIALTDPVASNPTPAEATRLFDPSSISGPYTSNVYDINLTDATTQYKIASNFTWTDFAPRGLNNLADRNGDAQAILIATAEFDSMAVGETINAAELAWWFGYE